MGINRSKKWESQFSCRKKMLNRGLIAWGWVFNNSLQAGIKKGDSSSSSTVAKRTDTEIWVHAARTSRWTEVSAHHSLEVSVDGCSTASHRSNGLIKSWLSSLWAWGRKLGYCSPTNKVWAHVVFLGGFLHLYRHVRQWKIMLHLLWGLKGLSSNLALHFH